MSLTKKEKEKKVGADARNIEKWPYPLSKD